MRWKEHVGPRYGDRKVVKRFLWFPQYYNGQWVWLESVYCEYEFLDYSDSGFTRRN